MIKSLIKFELPFLFSPVSFLRTALVSRLFSDNKK